MKIEVKDLDAKRVDKKCDYAFCNEIATTVEAAAGTLFNLCREHKKIVKKQKEANKQ